MKQSVAAVSIRNLKQNLRRFVSAASAAGTVLIILTLTAVVWISGCASSSAGSTITTNTTNTAPTITAQPTSATVIAGSTATFTSVATGTPIPTVQWLVSANGGASFSAVAGATSTTLNIATAGSQNGNVYEAVFTNTVSSVTSTGATLTVNSASVITTNPANVTVLAGANATFFAAANGAPVPAVQWQISTNGGTTFTSLAGATLPMLTFTATAGLDGNQYRAVFTNSVSSATTTTAMLNVNVAPVVTVNPRNVSVSVGNLATFTAAATGQPAPTMQWMISVNGGTTFAPVVGATSTTLSFTASAGMSGNAYEAVFTNAAGSITTSTALLTLSFAPTITVNPTSLTLVDGSTATFTAAAIGTPTPTVQWFISTNGGASFNAMVGATSTTLTFTASLALSQNLYQAVFTNSAGDATTTAALLTVTPIVIISVAINNPSNSPITLGTGGIINFSEAITNGTAGIGVNWNVNGVAGGNSTVGTITASTMDGALATYTAPASAPPSGTVAIVAAYAGTGSSASPAAIVNIVANQNSTLSGQFAFQVRGFQISGLPFGTVGTFTADGVGGLNNVLVDTNAAQDFDGDSLFTSKVAWNGNYSMDTVNHGIMHLTLASDPTVQMNFALTFSSGNGSIVEIDTPLGSTASGSFSAASSSSFTVAPGGLSGTYIMRLDGPDTGSDGYFALLGQMTFAQTGNSTTEGTVTGSATFDGTATNIIGGTVSMDADGSGHATIAVPFDNGITLTLSVYISSSGRIFTLDTDSFSVTLTGVLRSQTIPLGGFTAANIFTNAMLFEAIGVDPSNNLASVIVGGFSPSVCNPTTEIRGEYDQDDGGNVTGSSPTAFTATFTVDPTVPGLGTLTLGDSRTFVFYMRSPGEGFIAETSLVNSASLVGEIGSQIEPNGGFTLATLDGMTQNVGTETTTPASANGVAVINFGSGVYTASADGSALAQSPIVTVSSTGTVAITDAVHGRGIATPATGSIFGSAQAVFYMIDNTGAFIMISVDPTTLQPQIIIVAK
jgi:Immunoglobulin I-set domain